MNRQTLSIIITSIGKSNRLETLLCFLNKSLPKVHLVLVDTSLTRKLTDLAKKYNASYIPSPLQGLSYGRNLGAQVCKTKYIYFLDDDLLPSDNWITFIKNQLEKSEITIGGGPVIATNIPTDLPKKYFYLIGEKKLKDKSGPIASNYLGGCNIFFNKTVFDQLKGFRTRYGHQSATKTGLNEEVELQTRARLKNIPIFYITDLEVVHFWNGNNNSLLDRVSLQGKYDKKNDLEHNRLRLILRKIKYSLILPPLYLVLLFNTNHSQKWNYHKYHSYLFS